MSVAAPTALLAQLAPRARERYQQQRQRLGSRYFVDDAVSGNPAPFALQGHHEEILGKIHAGYRNHAVLEGGDAQMDTFLILLMLDMCIHQKSFCCALLGSKASLARQRAVDQIGFVATHSPYVGEQLATEPDAPAAAGWIFHNGSRLMVQEPGYVPVSHFNLLLDAAYLAEEEPRKFSDTLNGLGNGTEHDINVLLAKPHGYDNGFSQMLRRSMELAEDGELELFDWAPLFVAWHQHPDNVVEDPREIARFKPNAKQAAYLDQLQADTGLYLSPAQRAWWVSSCHNGFVDSLTSMEARFPLTIEEALAPDSALLLLRREMVALREQGRLVDGLEPLAGMPSYVFWNFGGRYAVNAFIVVQPHPKQPNEYQVVYAYQEADKRLQSCLDHLGGLKLDVAHHFFAEEEVRDQAGNYLAGTSSYKAAFQAANIDNYTVIGQANGRGAGFEAAARLAASVPISRSSAMELFDALYGVCRAYDPESPLVLDKLKLTGCALRHTFLYECFELAARVIHEKRLDPDSPNYFAPDFKKYLTGVHVY